jgi:enoyl-[acyl-carrier protein] reductase III
MGPTKSALESTLRYLAVELAPEGIRVNGVSGGIIATESISKFPESEKLVKDAVSRTPANRLGTPVDIADVVMFLINDASNFIYGQTIVVDGGLSLF